MAHVSNHCFQPTVWSWKTGSMTGVIAALSITALAVGILGWLQFIPSFDAASFPLMGGAAGALVLDGIWLMILLIKNRRPSHCDDPKIFSVRNSPLKADEYGLKCEEGRGFPLVERETRQQVIDQTIREVDSIEKSASKQNSFAPYLKHVKYIPNPQNQDCDLFFPEGDTLQTPVLMEYDETFQPLNGQNYFYMHSSAAPKPRNFKSEEEYLEAVEAAYFNLVTQQVASGAVHILTNYWGMGAFIRGYYKDRSEMYHFRVKIAQRLAHAFCRVVDASPHSNFTFYIGGPNGDSFHKDLQEEPRDNYNAFVLAFSACEEKYKQRVVLCPETDIFVKAQEISDSYECELGELATVSAINASDPVRLGNRWHEGKNNSRSGFNAEFAIEENVFRRSSFLGYLARIINAKKTCALGAASLISKN